MASLTFGTAFLGGCMIGAAVVLLLLLNGRIAGISGILAGALRPGSEDAPWRLAFLGGLAAGPVAYLALTGGWLEATPPASLPLAAAAGLLVGVGTRLGSGCTSGHGVCGLARLSPRSLVATLVFIGTGVATVTAMRLATGG